MKILKRYKELNAEWFETSLDECLERTEKSGYWKPGTVKPMLNEGNIVFTPFAEYKKA